MLGCSEIELDPSLPIEFTTPEKYLSYEQIPLESSIDEVQPMTGIVLWTDHDEVAEWPIQLEYSYMCYNDVCSKKGVYDWTVVDKLLDEIASRGHQAVLRFRYTYVGEECAVPDYIKKTSGYEETIGKSEGQKTAFPDWRSQELQDFHLDFYKRFAERYDSDARLAFLQVGFGLWAEYHIYDGPFILGQTFPSKEFQTKFLQQMDKDFQHCPWQFSIDAADGEYGPSQDKKSLLNLSFGNFDDSFMCKEHDGDNLEKWTFFGKDRWQKAPLGGEFSYYTDYDQKHCLDKTGLHGRLFENEAARFHLSYIIGNDQPQYQSKARFKEAAMSMGYRFSILDYRIQGEKAAICIANTGVAPIYRDAFLALEGIRNDHSLRNLLPGQYTWLEFSAAAISPTSVPQIECDHLVKGQRIGYNYL